MKYVAKVGVHEFEIDVDGGAATVDGIPIDAELWGIDSAGIANLRLGTRTVTVAMERSETGWLVQRAGHTVEVTVEDERDRFLKRFGPGDAGATRENVVKAPMPGMVLRVAVVTGDEVQQGEGLLVLEAMKMENEIKAPRAGKVAKVWAEAGRAVEKNTILVELVDEG